VSEQLPTYSFLPWLRVGMANSISQPDLPGANASARATIVVNLNLIGNNVNGSAAPAPGLSTSVSLYGPGDVVGVHQDAIIKVEPRNWITNFEPNFLPYIEFYDEDFPWRYTPAAADKGKHRLRPWLALVVLKAKEFVSGNGKPLPFLEVSSADIIGTVFPAPDQLWAWAHVHVNNDLSADGTNPSMPDVSSLEAALRANPDRAYSRILCPRRLEPDTLYHAFLIPAFETGRCAGLGIDSNATLTPAWGNGQTKFPYYYRWQFKTGAMGDFEYLVKILKSQPVDKRVGFRDMDVLHPGVGLPPIASPAELGGVLRLGGALRVPLGTLRPEDQAEVQKFEDWDEPFPHEFQEEMANRVNLADDYTRNEPAALHPDDPDPVVTSPLYGRWHALRSRLLQDAQGGNAHWVDELNLDPRFRAAAGLGAGVVQKNQEEYMNAAWEQVGDIIAANNRLRLAQFAMGASRSLFFKHIAAQNAPFLMTAPVHKRVIVDGVTVYSKIASSVVPPAVMSAPFRKLTRARGPIMKRLGVIAGTAMIEGINSGTFVPAPPKTEPKSAVKVSDAIMVLSFAGAGTAVIDGMAERQKPSVVDGFPTIPSFTIQDPREGKRVEWPKGDSDSDEAKAFKDALRDMFTFTGVEFPQTPKLPLDIEGLTKVVLHTLDPAVAIPKRTMGTVVIPEHIKADMLETFAPIMVYPVIDLPMYKPLSEISAELFLPHIDLIPPNSITLLEVNQKFIESYMMGLNHEMARELLWREYPTDQRGSYFRQFWDVSNMFTTDNPTEQDREPLRDIPKIHMWSRASTLGSHNHRDMGGNSGQLVLVIRGELLKRYPTAVIYAQKAVWPSNPSGERTLVELTDDEYDTLPDDKIRLPLFEAKIEPDIYLIGFNLSDVEAKGGEPPNGDPGWFFVIKERPGEARFGLDEATDGALPRLINWNNLTWGHVGTPPGSPIQIGQAITLLPKNQYNPQLDQENKPSDVDNQAHWNLNTNAADLAYILYQVPVLVAVHASRMLPDPTPGTP